MPTALILHGWGGQTKGNWQDFFAETLEAAGVKVLFPALPDAYEPKLEAWLNVIEDLIKDVDPSELIVTGHSLGGTVWLQYLHRHPEVKIKAAYLVAPPYIWSKRHAIGDFFPLEPMNLSGQNYTLVYSNNDPYIEEENFIAMKDAFKLKTFFIENAGHINTAAGYGKWPWIEDQCLKCLS